MIDLRSYMYVDFFIYIFLLVYIPGIGADYIARQSFEGNRNPFYYQHFSWGSENKRAKMALQNSPANLTSDAWVGVIFYPRSRQ